MTDKLFATIMAEGDPIDPDSKDIEYPREGIGHGANIWFRCLCGGDTFRVCTSYGYYTTSVQCTRCNNFAHVHQG
jgi:hypothetical protein